jgi:hypothetical protein
MHYFHYCIIFLILTALPRPSPLGIKKRVGGEILEIGEASLTGRKSSGVKRVWGALGSEF